MKVRSDSLIGGEKFNRITVICYSHTSKRKDGSTGERIMNCVCDCGSKLKVKTSNLKSGNTNSCGCYHSDQSIKSNKDRGSSVERIDEHMAYSCECGSVNFALLKSGGIECNHCGKATEFKFN